MATILLLEPDFTVRPLLVNNLRNWGYNVIVAIDEIDATQRVSGQSESFSLLLIDQVQQSIDDLLHWGQTLCQQAQLTQIIPIVIMAEQYGMELEGQNVQVGECEYVTYLEDGQQLRQLLYQLCPVQGN